MKGDLPAEAAALLHRAAREPLVPLAQRREATLLDRGAVEELLPHRDPFLFVDEVTFLDQDGGLIATRASLARAEAVFAGHFPGHPVWPGVLQVEAIAQAGGLLYLKRSGLAGVPQVALTHILGARFMRPVRPGADLEVVAGVFEDGLFVTIVGQCLQGETVCSLAALHVL